MQTDPAGKKKHIGPKRLPNAEPQERCSPPSSTSDQFRRSGGLGNCKKRDDRSDISGSFDTRSWSCKQSLVVRYKSEEECCLLMSPRNQMQPQTNPKGLYLCFRVSLMKCQAKRVFVVLPWPESGSPEAARSVPGLLVRLRLPLRSAELLGPGGRVAAEISAQSRGDVGRAPGAAERHLGALPVSEMEVVIDQVRRSFYRSCLSNPKRGPVAPRLRKLGCLGLVKVVMPVGNLVAHRSWRNLRRKATVKGSLKDVMFFQHQNKGTPPFTSCNVQVYNVQIPVNEGPLPWLKANRLQATSSNRLAVVSSACR